MSRFFARVFFARVTARVVVALLVRGEEKSKRSTGRREFTSSQTKNRTPNELTATTRRVKREICEQTRIECVLPRIYW